MTDIYNPIFTDKDKAREHLESIRWPDGPICPHCGVLDSATKLSGKSTRPGVYKCKACRKPFSVTVGTVFERSKIPLNKWLLATHLLCSSKKGMSAHQLHRILGVTYKTAWFMAHRIRESMKPTDNGPFGGGGQHVEADETYFGSPKHRYTTTFVSGKGWTYAKSARLEDMKIVTLVERGGRAKSFTVDSVNSNTINRILFTNVDRESTLNTDEGSWYISGGREFAKHQTMKHSAEEYVRGDATTNSIEGYFSIFKRGMKGVYQHCGEQHLNRYLCEFDFRCSNRKISDFERTDEALKGIEGRRLTYRRINDVRAA